MCVIKATIFSYFRFSYFTFIFLVAILNYTSVYNVDRRRLRDVTWDVM